MSTESQELFEVRLGEVITDPKEIITAPLGIYIITWFNDGRKSAASIYMDQSGDRWIAPTNWLSPGRLDNHRLAIYSLQKVRYVPLKDEGAPSKSKDEGAPSKSAEDQARILQLLGKIRVEVVTFEVVQGAIHKEQDNE